MQQDVVRVMVYSVAAERYEPCVWEADRWERIKCKAAPEEWRRHAFDEDGKAVYTFKNTYLTDERDV